MDQSSFHIIRTMPKIQYEGILEVEAVCPICRCEEVSYQKKYRCNQKVWQNYYRCKHCSTEWVGNSYTGDFKRITQVEERKLTTNSSPLLDGLAWLIKLNCCSDIYSL